MGGRELPEPLRRALDEVPVSILAEYLCVRVGLDKGEQELRIVFKDCRYDRVLPRRRRPRGASSRIS